MERAQWSPHWEELEAAASAARIMSPYKSKKCVNLAYGTSLIMSDCHDGNNQKFYFDA